MKNWYKINSYKTNWYKTAQSKFPTTIEELDSLSYEEKMSLADTPNLAPEYQKFLITIGEYVNKKYVLEGLAENSSITPECQILLVTNEYAGQSNILIYLALNLNIAHECQILLITSEYEGKDRVLGYLAQNRNFSLKGLSLQEKRYLLKPSKGCRFRILRDRLKEVREKVRL